MIFLSCFFVSFRGEDLACGEGVAAAHVKRWTGECCVAELQSDDLI